MAAMNDFLDDYPAGKAEGRYIDAELPALPFNDASFDLGALFALSVLVHHTVGRGISSFGDSRDVPCGQLKFASFHCWHWVRRHRRWSCRWLTSSGSRVSAFQLESVPFEFQRGGNQMMRIRRAIEDG